MKRWTHSIGPAMTKIRLMLTIGMLAAAGTGRATGQGRTDIFVAPLQQTGRTVVVGAPVNVTHRAGYDNQPSFTPDGAAILYTSIGDDGRASTWTLRTAGGAAPSRVTNSAIGIYSPQVMPDGKFFSVIRVEPDSTQRLWKFPIGGGEPALVIDRIKPIGYHTWVDARTVVVFVLGTPSTLQVVDVVTGSATTVASNIGRALVKVPHHDAVSFVQVVRDSGQWLAEYDVTTKAVRRLGRLPQGAEYVAWTPGGALITAARSVIYTWNDGEWVVAADLAAAGVRNISRLAISPSGDQLALVAEDPPMPASRPLN